MKEQQEQPIAVWWKAPFRRWTPLFQEREEQVFLALTLLIGALVGAIVVAFILLTERAGARLYPAGGATWRRLLVPMVGSLLIGYLLYRFFRMPEAAESRKQKWHYGHAVVGFRSEQFLANSSVRQRHLLAESPWDARDPQCRSAPESRPCLADMWDCGLKK